MSDRHPSSGPLVEGPHDPEHDPTASYALDRGYVTALTERVAASSGETVELRSPIGDQPLAHIPQSSEADVEAAFRRARVAEEVDHYLRRVEAERQSQEKLTDQEADEARVSAPEGPWAV